ncbi:MAG: DUF1566 domain-containing protein [Pseudomonadota bacterium]
MKVLARLVLAILVVTAFVGCGKKSGLEGKIVDGNGKPVANVKIVASQVQPIKGYERFETTTSSDGGFSFGGLFPTSEYVLFPWSETWGSAPMMTVQYDPTNLRAHFYKGGWTTERKMKIQSGPENQTLILPAPLSVRPALSIVEGQLLDGKGQPFSNLKIVAKQNQPMKGYEQFESITGGDGKFRFEKLFPTSEYTLTPVSEDWTTEVKSTVKTGLEEQTVSLSGPIKVVFLFSKDGLITDSRTELMWVPAPDRVINWDQADAYVRGLNIGGFGDWRLPNRGELKSLYKPSDQYKVHPAFRVTDKYVWTSELKDLATWYFGFTFRTGNEYAVSRYVPDGNRVLAVRFRK